MLHLCFMTIINYKNRINASDTMLSYSRGDVIYSSPLHKYKKWVFLHIIVAFFLPAICVILPFGLIQPGQRITVKAGFGDNTAAEFFMNSPTPMFENIDKFNGVGDGAYLLDEFGNLRFWTIYN